MAIKKVAVKWQLFISKQNHQIITLTQQTKSEHSNGNDSGQIYVSSIHIRHANLDLDVSAESSTLPTEAVSLGAQCLSSLSVAVLFSICIWQAKLGNVNINNISNQYTCNNCRTLENTHYITDLTLGPSNTECFPSAAMVRNKTMHLPVV